MIGDAHMVLQETKHTYRATAAGSEGRDQNAALVVRTDKAGRFVQHHCQRGGRIEVRLAGRRLDRQVVGLGLLPGEGHADQLALKRVEGSGLRSALHLETGRRTDDAKQFVRHLFEMGGTDADTATACLLAGEFNSGKSSFINALVGEDVCQVAPGPCTARIQELVYGPERTVANLGPSWDRDRPPARGRSLRRPRRRSSYAPVPPPRSAVSPVVDPRRR